MRARLAGMDRQTLRKWVHRYSDEGIAGLSNRPAPRRSPKLTVGQMAMLKAVVLAGPDPVVGGVVPWRIVDLCRWVSRSAGIGGRHCFVKRNWLSAPPPGEGQNRFPIASRRMRE